MRRYFRHLRDFQLLGLAAVTLVFIGMFLASRPDPSEARGSSWRKVDLQRLQQRLGAGDLSDHEAVWYHNRPETVMEGRDRGPGQ
ncbi:MAG: hypothetical protein GY703_10480 [Gammaproteobacteria bacterium]|nr:hypothetical protein [Gammaproteobacteria bacterium]